MLAGLVWYHLNPLFWCRYLYISDLFTGSLPSVKVVLEIAGNSVMEDRDDHNRTALVLATMGGHGEIVIFLLSEGGEYIDF